MLTADGLLIASRDIVPGAHEIMALHAALSVGVPSSRTLLPLPLHSMIAQSEQVSATDDH